MTEELKINAISLSDEQIQAILGEEIIVYDSDKETDGRIDVVLHEDQEQRLIGLVDDLREKHDIAGETVYDSPEGSE